MTPDKLPEEIQQEVIDNSLTYLASLYTDGYVKERYLDGTLSIPHEWKAIRKSYEEGAAAWAPWFVKHNSIQSELHGVRAENERLKKELKNAQDAAIMFCNKHNVSQTVIAEAFDFLNEIAEESCDHESVNFNKPVHSPDCRACKVREFLQQFKDGKGKEVDNG